MIFNIKTNPQITVEVLPNKKGGLLNRIFSAIVNAFNKHRERTIEEKIEYLEADIRNHYSDAIGYFIRLSDLYKQEYDNEESAAKAFFNFLDNERGFYDFSQIE